MTEKNESKRISLEDVGSIAEICQASIGSFHQRFQICIDNGYSNIFLNIFFLFVGFVNKMSQSDFPLGCIKCGSYFLFTRYICIRV